ncbi:DNA polymerase IV [Pseudomonas entomophila]|jgi:DNA polymerase-4|uniref:DNA polymerase IV n=1 Tax=Pseudomonas entomophila TaxID=312306 RepID=UPI0015E308C7|nr:DNA polymerase IV [Pseudomonas entomophila]MBA1194956.1 DNA polymerase IV [Pseudomonas entomophila]
MPFSIQNPRKFIHLDMDAYFVSVELLDAPHLRSAPVAVGGTAAERGVISTANYLARQFGIKSGMATATAQRLCPALVVLPVRFERYEAVTRQLEGLLRRYTDRVEFFSLDEASLEVTGQPQCGGSATRMASALRAEVQAELGLTASAGIAPLRYLAKIASEVNKPNGQFVIRPADVPGFLAGLDIRKLPGVGPQTWRVLERLGCRYCGDLTLSKIPVLLRHLGVHGYHLWMLGQGHEPDTEVSGDTRSVGVEHTLPADCSDGIECTRRLLALLPALRERIDTLAEGEQIVRNQVKLKFDDFSVASTEASATEVDEQVLRTLLQRLWQGRRAGRAVRLIGIAVKVRKPDPQATQLTFEW